MTRIATWNVNSLKVRLPQVLDWLAAEQPDILALQETKLVDEKFPSEEIEAAGYSAVFSGQKTYNGVAILSRKPALEVCRELPGAEDPQRRLLAVRVGDIRVVNVYVPNGQAVGSDKYTYKLAWLARLHAFLQAELKSHPALVLLGDFNIAPEDRDVHDPELWRGKVLCSDAERAALGELLAAGTRDVFRLFPQAEQTFSWWDYRMNGFRRNRGLRIDLILASEAFARHCTASRVDAGPRSLPRPSDHAPVLADFQDG